MAVNPFVSDANVILAFTAALLGFPTGIIIACLSKEELDDGRKYFRMMQHFLFALAVALLLFRFQLHIALIIVISVLSFFIPSILYMLINNRMAIFMILYIALGIAYALSVSNIFMLVFLLGVIFLFGLATGSLFAEEYIFKKKAKKQKKRE